MSDLRGIFPGVFTMGNLLCGFLSIISANNNTPSRAAWFIVLAGISDSLDGKVARLSRSTSRFGKELDSLADIVSFGVAPAFLMHIAGLEEFDRLSWMVGAFFVMCGAFRLARYNVLADPHRKDHFLGLPIPIAGITVASYVILCMKYFKEIVYPEYLISLVVVCSILMVSTVVYDSLPERLDSKENRWKAAAIGIFLIAFAIKPRMMLFPGLCTYILTGMVREFWRMLGYGRRIIRERRNGTK